MNEIIELTKKLMRFRTVSTNREELHRCADFIESYIKRPVERPFRTPSLVVGEGLFFVAHFDVVHSETFKPRISDGRLYGRGSLDCKSSVALLMKLANEHDIGVILTADEEVGGSTLPRILEKHKCDFGLVLDGGKNFNIVTQEKGALHVKITARGKQAHGSTPWKGENAVEKLLKIYNDLKTFFPEGNDWRRTINLGRIQGGKAPNQVPDKASMWVDMRFVSDQERDIIKEKISSLDHQILTDASVLNVDKKNKYIRRLQKSVRKITGKSRITREHGASDARHFASKGIPTALIWPKGGKIHSKDEYLDIESVGTLYKILKEFIQSLGY